MKFPTPLSVTAIAQRFNAKPVGDSTLHATGINEIHKAESGDIIFVDVEKYFKKSLYSPASIIFINKEVECPDGKVLLVMDDPFTAYNTLVQEHRPFIPLRQNIHPTAIIEPSAILEPNVVIGAHVIIGKDCYIQANASIMEHTIIGNNVTIQAGAIIGTDAFYFKKTKEGFKKWRSGGRVIIEDKVEIGAGCTINKGVSGDTVIGEGTKLDSQVHIGHGVVVGKNCLLAAQVGIAGKTIIGDNCVLYGQAGVAQNLTIGDNTIISAKAGVSKNLAGGKIYFGTPATEARTMYKELAALRHLPEFFKNYYKND